MDSRIVKESLTRLSKYFPTELLATGWYFDDERPENAIVFEQGKLACIFQFIERILNGKQLCFSAQLTGCSGAACYLGFNKPSKQGGVFFAEKEKFKKCIEFGNIFYNEIKAVETKHNYLILGKIADIPENKKIEVVNLWINGLTLSGLVTLANYDKPTNNNVSIPFASGCQGMWTIPYKEKSNQNPTAIVGGIDPSIRKYIPPEVLLFSVPCERFVELSENAEGSFLQNSSWENLIC